MIIQSIKSKIGNLKNGNRRIYIPNTEALNNANFFGDTRYKLYLEGKTLVLEPSLTGKNKVVNTSRGEDVIELRNKLITQFLGQNSQYITVTLKPGRITISIHHSEERQHIREEHFLGNLIKKTLSTGSLYAGIGLLTLRIHKGMQQAGIKPVMKFANEIDPIAAKINAHYNPIWKHTHDDALLLQDSIETCDPALLPTGIDHLDIGQVCTPYSKMTPVNMRDINHQSAGCLFISTINAIATINPATLTLECTPAFKNSVAFKGVIHALKITGYEYQTTEVKGSDYGDFEVRNRFCLFAYSKGLAHLFPRIETIEQFQKTNKFTLSDIKENIDINSSLWKSYEHIKRRDLMKDNGYKNILVPDEASTIPALLASYSAPKASSPFIPHPTDNMKQRQITVLEHCRIRRTPKELTQALIMLAKGELLGTRRTNVKAAHRCLGNGPCPTPWSILSFSMFSHALSALEVNTLGDVA